MTIRRVGGVASFETPRLKDLHAVATAREPSEGRDPSGRFAAGNGAATERAAKAIVKPTFGEGADPSMIKAATVMYRAMLRDLPSDGPSVRQLTASRCRHAVLATTFADEAIKVGLTTPQGIKLAEQSRAHDLAAQRLAVTAFDLSTRDAVARGKAPLDLGAAMIAAGKPRHRT